MILRKFKLLNFFLFILVALLIVTPVFASDVINTESCTNPKSSKTLSYYSDDDLLKFISEVNRTNVIIDNGFYVRKLRTFIDNNSFSDSVIGPNGYYANFGTINRFVETPLASFGYYNVSPGVKLCRVYDDELRQWNTEHQYFRNFAYNFNESDKIISRSENKGILTIVVTGEYTGVWNTMYEDYKVPVPEKIDSTYSIYTLDIASGLILTEEIYIIIDGVKSLLSTAVTEYYKKQPYIDKVKFLYDEVCGGNTHTIKIIVGHDTEREKRYQLTANEGSYLDPWIMDVNGQYAYYLDPEYTTPCPTDSNGYIPYDSDKVIYMK